MRTSEHAVPVRLGRRTRSGPAWAAALAALAAWAAPALAHPQIVEEYVISSPVVQGQPVASATYDLRIELFVRPDSQQSHKAELFLRDLEQRRPGLKVDVYDVSQNARALARVKALSTQFGRSAALPTVYAANQMVVGFKSNETTGRQIEGLFNMEVFIRNGCPRCAAATPYLAGLQQRYPGLSVSFAEVTTDPNAQARLAELCRAYGVPSGIPAVHFGGRLNVGWSGIEISGGQIESLLQSVSAPHQPPRAVPPAAPVAPAAPAAEPAPSQPAPAAPAAPADPGATSPAPAPPPGTAGLGSPALWQHLTPLLLTALQDPAPTAASADPLPDDLPAELELPDEADAGEAGTTVLRPLKQDAPQSINVPFFGRLDPRLVGMPAFTFTLGLVDGFNPCAMWVLVFLLSVLVGLNDRRKMIAIAGTFVAVSGLAYFLFMAAWLNAFQLIGVLNPRMIGPVQAILGVLAVVVGMIHVKDFFAFKKGISLSIPESAKPTIYARVRQIVSARSLVPALLGAIVLAVLVNAVELLCTAGIPAIYTQILSAQGHPALVNYAYLALYIVAYMLDDTIMLIVVVSTLSRRRLQETEGRWLKLVSGAVILSLGVLMLVKPEWLH